jgi:hypothetical protein
MAGLFDGLSDPSQGGLMGMFANPQTAGLLGMAGGLLSASGPSRLPISTGQALGAGLQGMGAGFNNALQMQRGLYQMRMLQGLMGDQGGPAPAQSAPASASTPMPAVTGAANTGPLSGLSAGLGASAPLPSQAASSAASAYPASAAGGPIFGMTPQQAFQRGLVMSAMGMQGGGDLMKIAAQYDPALAAQMPTDITKMGTQAGWSPQQIQQANADAILKNNAVSIRPGGGIMTGGRFMMTPGQAPAGYMNQQNADGTWSVVPVAGGPDAVKGSAAAGAIGRAYGETGTGYQNGQPVFVNKGVLADQTAGGVPGFTPFQNAIRAAESGGNPAAVNPASGAVGSMQTLPSTATNPGFGVTPARDNSPAELQRVGADYAAAMQRKYGNDTDAAVAYNWGPQNADRWIAAGRPWNALPAETQGYVGRVMTQMQNYGGGSGAGSTVTPELAPGAKTAANESQGAPSKQMADMQQHLADSDNSYQQSRQALLKMIGITQNGGFGDTVARLLPESVGTRFSNDAAEYQKAHANFVSLQGKALGSGGTDASRATLDEAVPTFDKPSDARLSGLTDQLNQLDWNHLKRQTLNPTFTQGDEKGYTKQSAAFDNAITPAMMPKLMPILSMPSSPARTQALQQAIQDPQMKAALDLMVQTGQLK